MREEPPKWKTIEHDTWEIFNGDVNAFRKRWGMFETDLEGDELRRLTASEYVIDILGIDHDG